jgi:hypothetical protein
MKVSIHKFNIPNWLEKWRNDRRGTFTFYLKSVF